MQIFEALEIREFPFFLSVEVTEGEIVGDVINDYNSHKVYLLVDHDTKRIWTYNGPHSSFKLQIYGAILASMLRKQLRLFYRIYSLNSYLKDDPHFQEIMEKPLAGGRAKTIDKEDFSEASKEINIDDIVIHSPRLSKALESINDVPQPEEFVRIFLIIGGILYSEQEMSEKFFSEEKTKKELLKMGRLNNGFTFFNDRNYSTRIIVKERSIQGIELYVPSYEKVPSVELKIPLIEEDKISKEGKIDSLINAFKIPERLSDNVISKDRHLQHDDN
ncbi:MAG: hypothetical protein ACFFC9_02425 [Promethearchaeota archaeon]